MNTDTSNSFLDRYRGMHSDELVGIFMKREDLVEEARLAIESVVIERGIDVKGEIEEIENEQQARTAAKKNSPSRWLIALHGLALALAVTPARFIETGSAIGDGLLVMAAGALGWSLSVIAVENLYKLEIKKSKRTVILFLLPIGYFVLYLTIFVMIFDKK